MGRRSVMAAAGFAACVLCVSAADVWYVDGKRAETGDGTAARPFQKIQEAVDAAAPGDTVYVAAGTYDAGSRTDGFQTSMENRVYIDKSLTLVGEDRHRTHIVGRRATVAQDTYGFGIGADAVRCLGIKASDVIISNLTLTGGATRSPAAVDDPDGNGGGVFVDTASRNVFIVDCIISNNVAYRAGAARFGRDEAVFHPVLVRTWIHDNRAANANPATRNFRHVHTLVTHHVWGGGLFSSGSFVNCTFADNYARNVGPVTAANCFFADHLYKEDVSGTSYSHCGFPIDSTMVDTTILKATACLYNIGRDQFVAPLLHDYRLHHEANVLGKGDVAHLDALDLPDAYKYTDFHGAPVDRQASACDLGCSQEEVTPTGGTLRFASLPDVASASAAGVVFNNTVFFNGRALVRRELAYVRSTRWPEWVKVSVSCGTWKAIHSFSASGADTVRRYPYLDGTWELVPPTGRHEEVVLQPIAADYVFYVNQAKAGATPDGSAGNPYADVQDAIDQVPEGKTAVIYSEGGTFASRATACQGLACRVCVPDTKNVRLVGVGGPAKNAIVGGTAAGASMDAWPWGMGATATRCLYLGGASAIQGFTLTGGRTDCLATSGNGRRGAAAFLGAGAWITDCVITNNIGCQGVAVNGQETGVVPTAFAARCLVAGNRGFDYTKQEERGSGFFRSLRGGAYLVVANNGGSFDGSYETNFFYQCSVYSTCSGYNVVNSLSRFQNSLIHLDSDGGQMNRPYLQGAAVSYREGMGDAGNGSSSWVRADPLFADPVACDLRVGAVSPAKTVGTNAVDGLGYVFIGRDFYGNRPLFLDGKPLCGAVQAFAPTLVTEGTGIAPAGTNVYTTADVSVTLTATQVRPFLGFEINGVTQAVSGTSLTVSVPAVGADAAPLVVRACYDTNWYVDGATGDDGQTGTAAQPKKTLKGALAHAVAGDVVHVAPGTYATEEMVQPTKVFANTSSFRTMCRAYIPAGVEVRATGTPEETFIVGKTSPNPVEIGCGEGAVRAVFMEANARLTGFTVTGGRTAFVSGENTDNVNGGGILARNETACISDCIISNNAAQRGGGGFFGTYQRCRILENGVVTAGNGAAIRGDYSRARLRNCLVARNGGWATLYFAYLDHCTLAADNHQSGNENAMTILASCERVNNTLILGWKGFNAQVNLTRCVYGAKTANEVAKTQGTDTPVNATDCRVAAHEAELRVDDQTYAPVIGANLAVDAADETLAETSDIGAWDVYRQPRAVNGRLADVGAVEADWRPVYAQTLGVAVTAVTAASPEVMQTAAGVSIPAGASLMATVGRAGSAGETFEAVLSVAAGGTCALAWDAAAPFDTRTAGDGQTVRFVLPEEGASLRVSASGAAVCVNAIRSEKKFLILLR